MGIGRKIFAPQIGKEDVVLEYGVGNGWNLSAISCLRRIGYDIAATVADQVVAQGIEFINNINNVPDGGANVIICHHTLEHVPNPMNSLAEMHRILPPGGKLLLTVPYENARQFRKYNPHEPNHHLFSWNAQTIGNLLAVSGFCPKNIKVEKYGYDRAAAVAANRLRSGKFGFKAIRQVGLLLKPHYELRALAIRL